MINLNDSMYWEWFNGIPFGSVNHPILVVTLNDSLGLPSESQPVEVRANSFPTESFLVRQFNRFYGYVWICSKIAFFYCQFLYFCFSCFFGQES